MKKTKQIALFFLSLCSSTGFAQEATNASGGNASGIGGSASYSVGQASYTTNSNANGNISQGVQQAFEIFSVGIAENNFKTSLSAFPNPTSDCLILNVDETQLSNLSFQLIDVQGKVLITELILQGQTKINTLELPAASYFLNIIQNNKQVKSFKIIKK